MKRKKCYKCQALFFDRKELRRHITRQHVLMLGEKYRLSNQDILRVPSPSGLSSCSSLPSFHWSEFDPQGSTRATSPALSDSSLESFSWSDFPPPPSTSTSTSTSTSAPHSSSFSFTSTSTPAAPSYLPQPASSTSTLTSSYQPSLHPSSPSTVTPQPSLPRSHPLGPSLSGVSCV